MASQAPKPGPDGASFFQSSLFHWLVLLVAIAAAVGVMRTWRPKILEPDAPSMDAAIGKELVGFHVAPLTMEGEEVALDDLRGEVTLINYWGTWCTPCVEEFPHLAELEERLRGRPGFRMISVSCGGEMVEEKSKLKADTEAFLADQSFGAGVYWDPQQSSRVALVRSAEIDFVYPLTVIIDQSGKIAGVWRGYQEGYILEMEHLVQKLLKQPAT